MIHSHLLSLSMIIAYTDFTMWSSTHMCTLLVIAVVITGIILWGRSLPPAGRSLVCKTIALANLVVYIAEYTWRFCDDPWDYILVHKLPLHFCAIMALVCFIALWWGPRWARSLVYFGVLSASIQGLLTPTLTYGFPSIHFTIFFLSHGLLLLAALVIPFLTDWKAKSKDPLRSVLLMNVYLIAVHPINLLLHSNYGFTTAAPAGSILSALGPAPWYYLWLELPALGLFYLMYLPVRRKPCTATPEK